MSHGQETYTKEDIKKIIESDQFKIPNATRLLFVILIVLGVVSFITDVTSSPEGQKHAWMSLHVNFLYWFGMSAASCGFAAAFHICNAQWVRPIKRVFESALPFFMLSPLLLIVMYFGAEDIYSWAQHPIEGKSTWLSSCFLYTRDIIAAYLLVWIISRVIKGSLTMDFTALNRGLVSLDKSHPNYARWVEKKCVSCIEEKGEPASAIKAVYDKMGFYSPISVMIYALAMSLLAFDLLMSVDPHWYSTMFGGFYFMSCVYCAVAFAAIAMSIVLSQSSLFREAVKKKTLHDLGKLLFGFGIFWAYLFWSHYLPIWYGNMPEETGYIIVRLREYPWRNIAWMVLGMCFIVPFILGISRDLKQVPILLSLTGVIVAMGLWIQYYLLFAPTLYPSYVSLNMHDVGLGLGFLGVYGLLATRYLSSVPLIPFGDLLMKKNSSH